MLRRALIVTAAATVFALSAGMLFGRSGSVDAAKPVLVPGTASISSDASGNCVVTVTWSGLRGGKPMIVTTRLIDATGVPIWGGGKNTDVRSGDGQVTVVYDPDIQGGESVDFSFSDNRSRPLLDEETFTSADGSC